MEGTLAGELSEQGTIQKLLSYSMIWMPHLLSWIIIVWLIYLKVSGLVDHD